MVLIGLVGKAGSGKSTIADIFQAHYDTSYLWGQLYFKISFADRLKDCIKALFDLRRLDKDEYCETTNCTYGRVCQIMGQMMKKEFGEDFWIKLALGNNPGFREDYDYPHTIITDVRFKNEADTVRRLGGKLIRILRDAPPPVDGRDPNDVSETELESIKADYVIENNGTIDELHSTFFDIMIAILYPTIPQLLLK